ncbi:MAG: ABC transporter ATP-binding protein [Clostridiales bacterium]|nr:ABC transporter ATP-binding protein [Clostridiales bacterium]
MTNSNIIELVNISKSFDGDLVLGSVNLSIRDGEFITLLGPSGCGKTTMLRIIGGFLFPDTGRVMFDGKDITRLPPYQRQLNTVFQKYALFPFLNVYENVAFGLRIKKMPEEKIRARVSEMLELVNLPGFEKRGVTALSGGQQQRVAIARALAADPDVLLLDEPLGALDLKLRKAMQIELKRIQQQADITFVYVTHDQEEALTMSDTVVVMNKGNIQQIGTPESVYNEPINAFVADFIGESNQLEGIMREDYLVEFNGRRYRCVDRGFAKNEPIEVVIRPEDLTICPPEQGNISGIVQTCVFMGQNYAIEVLQDDYLWTVHSIYHAAPGSPIHLYLEPDAIHIMKEFDNDDAYPDDPEEELLAGAEEEEL